MIPSFPKFTKLYQRKATRNRSKYTCFPGWRPLEFHNILSVTWAWLTLTTVPGSPEEFMASYTFKHIKYCKYYRGVWMVNTRKTEKLHLTFYLEQTRNWCLKIPFCFECIYFCWNSNCMPSKLLCFQPQFMNAFLLRSPQAKRIQHWFVV